MRLGLVVVASWTLLGCPSSSQPSAPTTLNAHVAPLPVVQWPQRLRFGVTPVLDTDSLRRGNQPLCDEIGRLLGTQVQLVVSEQYGDLGGMLARGEVDFARFSPLAYVVAQNATPQLRIVASQIADSSTDYAAYIVSRSDSDIHRTEDLRGRSMGFVDPSSASGYLYPLVHVGDRFGAPERFFSRIEFLGNHENLLRAVASGRVDAGATFSAALATYGKMGLGSDFRIVAKTGRIPYDAFAAGPTLDEVQVKALQSALLGIDTRSPRGRRVLGALRHINGFLPGDDHLYDQVRVVLERATLHGTHIGTSKASEDAGH